MAEDSILDHDPNAMDVEPTPPHWHDGLEEAPEEALPEPGEESRDSTKKRDHANLDCMGPSLWVSVVLQYEQQRE